MKMKNSEFKKAEAEIFKENIWPILFPKSTEYASVQNVELKTDFIYGGRDLYLTAKQSDERFFGIKYKEVPFSQSTIDAIRKDYAEKTGQNLTSFYGKTRQAPSTTDKRLVHSYILKIEGSVPNCTKKSCDTSFRRKLIYTTMESPFFTIDHRNPFENHSIDAEIFRSYDTDTLPNAKVSYTLTKGEIHNLGTDWSIFDKIKDDLQIPIKLGDEDLLRVEIKPSNLNKGNLTINTSIPTPVSRSSDFEVSEKLKHLEDLVKEAERVLCYGI